MKQIQQTKQPETSRSVWQRLREHPVWLGILAVELLVLLNLCLALTKPVLNLEYAGSDLSGLQNELPVAKGEDGTISLQPGHETTFQTMWDAVTDETNIGVGLFGTKWRSINRGRYLFTIAYSAPQPGTAETVVGTLRANVANAQSAGYDLAMTADQTSVSGHFWIQNRKGNVTFQIYAQDPGLTVSRVTVQEDWSWRVVLLVTALVLFVLADLLVYALTPGNAWITDARDRAVLFGLVAVTLLIGYPTFSDFAGHGPDTYFHFNRIWSIAQGLKSGQFPVRIYPDFLNGYGYASPIFYGETLLYFPALLVLAGFPLYQALNALIFVIGALTVAIGWVSFYKMFGSRMAAFTATVLYATASYRLTDCYWRHGIGEAIAIAFLPLLAWGFWALYADDAPKKEHDRAWLPLMLGFTGLIQSHTVSTEIMAFTAVALVLLCARRAFRRDNLLILLKGAGLTVLVNLWFVVPFLQYLRDPYRGTVLANRNLNENRTPVGFLFRLWDEDLSTLALRIGGALVVGAALYLFCRAVFQHSPRRANQIGTVSAILGGIGTYLVCALDWNGLYDLLGETVAKILCNIQFPFRYLMPVSLCFALMAGCGVLILTQVRGKRAGAASAAGLVVLTCLLAWMDCGMYAHGYIGRNRTAEGRDIQSGKDNSMLEYLPEGFHEEWTDDTSLQCVDGAEVSASTREPLCFTVTARNPTGGDASVELPLIYYPGYRLTANDGGTVSVAKTAGGKVAVILSPGYSGTFTVRFVPPRLWRLCELISAATVLVLIFRPFSRPFLKKRPRRKNFKQDKSS